MYVHATWRGRGHAGDCHPNGRLGICKSPIRISFTAYPSSRSRQGVLRQCVLPLGERSNVTNAAPEQFPLSQTKSDNDISMADAMQQQTQRDQQHPVVLILVGTMGSGKSTFAEALVSGAATPWIRVNQDQLKTRAKCKAAARAALRTGKNCIIDRCNFDQQQRSVWVDTANELAAACCCVWLDYPSKVAALRAQQRTNHEGGLIGPQARGLSYSTHRKISESGGPALSEGLLHIARVCTDAQAAVVLKEWQRYTRGQLQLTKTAIDDKLRAMQGRPHGSKPITAWLSPQQSRVGSGHDRAPPAASQVIAPAASNALAPLGIAPSGAAPGPAAEHMMLTSESADAAAAAAGGCVPKAGTPRNAFAAMMAASRASSRGASSRGAHRPQASHPHVSTPRLAEEHGTSSNDGSGLSLMDWDNRRGGATIMRFVGWAHRPEEMQISAPDVYISHDEHILLIRDAYPKAMLHVLVIARAAHLWDMSCLRREDIPLLQHMIKTATAWTQSQGIDLDRVAMGFHWIPSMRQLHMHVISMDLDSPCLKRPEHWRSFTTELFRPANQVLGELHAHGYAHMDMQYARRLTKAKLCCRICGLPQKNLPETLSHYRACFAASTQNRASATDNSEQSANRKSNSP